MNKRKSTRTLSLLLVLCLLVSAASAAVQPRFAWIRSLYADLSISSSGLAECHSEVSLLNSSDTVTLTMELQRSSNGSSWSTIKTWSTSGSGTVSLDKSWYVTSGYYFQVLATAKVYNSSGSLVETATATSVTIRY